MKDGILKSSRKGGYYSGSRIPRRLRGRSFIRVVIALALGVIGFSFLRQRLFRSIDPQEFKNEEAVLGNCLSIEALRHADECFEAFDFSKGQQPKRVKKLKSAHLDREEDIPWVSSYGLVLDYDTVYDTFTTSSDEERYTTKRTLKCLTGFSMSIVWDFQYSTSLLHAYKSGIYGVQPDATHSSTVSCPPLDSESSASMSIKINCGFDIKRDSYGHPATDKDKAELETCIRMAWSWVKGRIGEQIIEPWAELCDADANGDLHCDSSRFHLEGTD